MKKIELDFATHRGAKVVFIRFQRDEVLHALVRQLEDCKWSATNKAWYVPYSKTVLHVIKGLFEPVCSIDATRLKAKLTAAQKDPKNKTLSAEAVANINRFKDWMLSRRYSKSTVETYCDALKTFLRYYHQKKVETITNADIVAFNNAYILANNFSSSYQNQVVNAIKLFFKTVQGTQLELELIHRPKREKLLPNVLSKEEVKAILEAPTFLKHRTMLSLIYACGLRCGELLRLKPEHVDANRHVLIIKQSKGKKDRIAPLSGKVIAMLRSYYVTFRPQVFLFEGAKPGEAYDERSLQNVLKLCVKKAGITKPVTLHWLRHSYATHLLENGTDLRYIQEILGHRSSKTTEIYTHVSTKSIQNITSPYDWL